MYNVTRKQTFPCSLFCTRKCLEHSLVEVIEIFVGHMYYYELSVNLSHYLYNISKPTKYGVPQVDLSGGKVDSSLEKSRHLVQINYVLKK